MAAVVVTLMGQAVVWVGGDARRRGFDMVWLMQVLPVVEFPWAWLMYYLLSRQLDRDAGGAAGQLVASR